MAINGYKLQVGRGHDARTTWTSAWTAHARTAECAWIFWAASSAHVHSVFQLLAKLVVDHLLTPVLNAIQDSLVPRAVCNWSSAAQIRAKTTPYVSSSTTPTSATASPTSTGTAANTDMTTAHCHHCQSENQKSNKFCFSSP